MADNETEEQKKQREQREYYAFADKPQGFDFAKHVDIVMQKFNALTNKEQDNTCRELAQRFTAHGFEGMSREDAILFFDQYKQMGIDKKSPENLAKIAEMLSLLPQTNDSALISHGKFSPLVEFNRFRRRVSLQNAATSLQRVEDRFNQQEAALNYQYQGPKATVVDGKIKIDDQQAVKDYKAVLTSRENNLYNRWYQYANPISWVRQTSINSKKSDLENGYPTRLYDMTDNDFSTARVNSGNLGRFWLNVQQKASKLLALTREAKEAKITRLEGKIAGSSKWNPMTWSARTRLGMVKSSKQAQEKKSIKAAPLNVLAAHQLVLEQKKDNLEARIKQGDTTQNIAHMQKELERLAILSSHIKTVTQQKQMDYKKALGNVQSKRTIATKPLVESIGRRYELINQKTDSLEHSTTSGKWLHAVLQNAEPAQRKTLEAIVQTRKNQTFTTEKEFETFVKEQLTAGGYKKGNEQLQTVIAKAVARKEGRFFGENMEVVSPSPVEESRSGEGSVHEGHSTTPPAPTKEWHEGSEEAIKENYHTELYDVVTPQREGQNANNENVLYQTFKSKEDDHIVTVEKPDANNYNLSAKDKDGNDSIPSVDDMKAAMAALKKEGHKSMELGDIQTPEFLARAIIAAEESGIQITNLKETKEKMAALSNEKEVKGAITKANAQNTLKGAEIDTSTPDGVKKVVTKMDALVKIKGLSAEEYQAFKQDKGFQKLKLNDKEEKLFDNVNKLMSSKEFQGTKDEKKQAMLVGRMISNYQSAYTQKTTAGGAQTKAKQKFVTEKSSSLNLATNRSSGGR